MYLKFDEEAKMQTAYEILLKAHNLPDKQNFQLSIQEPSISTLYYDLKQKVRYIVEAEEEAKNANNIDYYSLLVGSNKKEKAQEGRQRIYSEQVVQPTKPGYSKRFIYYTNFQIKNIYDSIKFPSEFPDALKNKKFSKEIMENVFRPQRISELSYTILPHQRNRKKSFDPQDFKMKKTTVLSGNHLNFRQRGSSGEENSAAVKNTLASEKVA